MEAFPQGTAGGDEQPAPGADGAAEPGEHLLHECSAAVPLQPDPPHAVFPLGKVELSPARVSWFGHSSQIFLLGTIFHLKDACCHGDVQGKHLPAPPRQFQSDWPLAAFLPLWEPSSFYCWRLQHDTFFAILMVIPISAVSMMIPTTLWDLQSPSSQVAALRAVLCLHLFQVSVLCSHLKAVAIFSCFTWNSPLFSKGDWGLCNCLWLFDVWYVAWRVWLCFPWGFSFHLWEEVPSF